MRIRLYEPIIGPLEKQYVTSALDKKEVSGLSGKFVANFESRFSRYSESRYGIAVSSGTAALHLAVASLGIAQRQKVLVSSFTNMATFFAVLYVGAVPIPIDIEPDTWNINPALIEEKVDADTVAILPVHIYGHPVDMDPISKIAKERELYVIEDCAEAHGACYKGRKVGSLGDVGCFSFYGNKIITTGEGGMLTTNNKSLAERARLLRSLAFGKGKRFVHEAIGFNYRMPNVQAAIGCAQMRRIDSIISRKRDIAKFYGDELTNVPGIQLPVEKKYAKNVYWMYHLLIEPKAFGCTRDRLMEELRARGIEVREAFVPFSMQKPLITLGLSRRNDCPVARDVANRGLYIPSGPLLTTRQLDNVVTAIKSIHSENKR